MQTLLCARRVTWASRPSLLKRPSSSGNEGKGNNTNKILNWFTKNVTETPPPSQQNEPQEVEAFLSDLFDHTTKQDKNNELNKKEVLNEVVQSITSEKEEVENLKSLLKTGAGKEALQKSSRDLQSLQYWDLYPKQIKKWLVFTKSKPGFYDGSGKWIEIRTYDMDFTQEFDEEERSHWMTLYEEEQTRLDPDLRGHFRFGVTHEEIKGFHPKIVRLFSFTFASEREKLSIRKQFAIQKWRQHEFDTASDAIQIDILTQRIRQLAQHLQKNKQDKHNARFLGKLLKRRKGLMLHLKKRDVPLYYEVLREIKLRDLYELYY